MFAGTNSLQSKAKYMKSQAVFIFGMQVAGVKNKSIVFLFNDTQIINETMLEDINGILNSGDVPNLYGGYFRFATVLEKKIF